MQKFVAGFQLSRLKSCATIRKLTLHVTIQEYPATNSTGIKKQVMQRSVFLPGQDHLLTNSSPSVISFFSVSSMPSIAFCSNALSVCQLAYALRYHFTEQQSG